MYTRQATWTDANDNNDERISEPMSISRDTIDVITFSSSLFFYRLFFRYSAGLPLRHDMSTGNSLIATTRQEAVDNDDGSDFFIDVSDHLTTGSRTINAQHECCTFTRYHFLTRAYCF